MPLPAHIIVIGAGPRGFAILERVLSRVRGREAAVSVTVVDPAGPGPGSHGENLPEYLMLNTVAGQATAFADAVMTDGAPVIGGPSFLDWCRSNELRAPVLPDAQTRPVQFSDFMPRAEFGRYMSWAWTSLVDRAPPNVSLRVIQATVSKVESSGRVVMDGNEAVSGDLVFVATGHGPATARQRGVGCTLPGSVEHIAPGADVAIAGMGLTALDIVAALTVGRGGDFQATDAGVVYMPSGQEPRISMFSRNGWLACARPEHPRRTPRTDHFRFSEDRLTARLGDDRARLSLSDDVLPMLLKDVLAPGLDTEEHRVASRIVGRAGPERWSDADAYESDVLTTSEWDVGEARRGLGHSRFKDRMEILRDCRETLRWVVGSGRLRPGDHGAFFRTVPPMANRAAVGPQIDRLRELHAVVRAGVVRLPYGPAPLVQRSGADWVLTSTRLTREYRASVTEIIDGYLPFPDPSRATELDRSLRSWAAMHPEEPHFLALTEEGFVRTRSGAACTRVCVIGVPSEGANFYNNYVLWPGVRSELLCRIDRVLDCVTSD